MSSNSPQRPNEGREHSGDKTFQLPPEADDAASGETPSGSSDSVLGSTFQQSAAGDSHVASTDSTLHEPPPVDATMQMPLEPGEEAPTTGKESESWHTQTAIV